MALNRKSMVLHHGLASLEVLLPELRYPLELRIALRVGLQRLLILRLPPRITVPFQQLLDHANTHRLMHPLRHGLCYLAWLQIRPHYIMLRTTSRVLTHHLHKHGVLVAFQFQLALASSPFFRTRSPAGSCSSSRSSSPCRIVFGSVSNN